MVAAGTILRAGRLPGEEIAVATETSDSSTFTTTETSIGSVTASLISGVTYWVYAQVPISSSGTGDDVDVRIRQDNVSGTEMALTTIDIVSATTPTVAVLRARYTAGSTGSKTFVVTGDRVGGSNNIRREASSTRPQIMAVTVAA